MGERSTCWLSADTLDREAPGLPSGVAHLFPQIQIWRWLPVAQWLGPLAIFSVKGSESHTPGPGVSGLEAACSASPPGVIWASPRGGAVGPVPAHPPEGHRAHCLGARVGRALNAPITF